MSTKPGQLQCGSFTPSGRWSSSTWVLAFTRMKPRRWAAVLTRFLHHRGRFSGLHCWGLDFPQVRREGRSRFFVAGKRCPMLVLGNHIPIGFTDCNSNTTGVGFLCGCRLAPVFGSGCKVLPRRIHGHRSHGSERCWFCCYRDLYSDHPLDGGDSGLALGIYLSMPWPLCGLVLPSAFAQRLKFMNLVSR